jgi:hypothetical protein
MAENDDILGASFTINTGDLQRSASEMLRSLDEIKGSVDKNASAIEQMSERLSKGTLKSKDAIATLRSTLASTSENISKFAAENERALERLNKQRDALQVRRSGNYNSSELNTISAKISKLDAESNARQQINKVLDEQRIKAAQVSDELNKIDTSKINNQSASLRSEIKGIAAALAEMEAAGLRGTNEYNRLQERGAKLTDMMGDARTQIKLLSHDNAGLQGVISGVQGITGAFTAATGVMTLFGSKNDELQKAMLKVQAVMSISMGIQQTLNALNKDSAFRLGVIGRLEKAWAAAKAQAAAETTKQVVAETAENAQKAQASALNTSAAASQTALNTSVEAGTAANTAHAFSWRAVGIAIKSVPMFGWVITALTALAAAVALFAKRAKEASLEKKLMSEAIKSVANDIAKEQTQLDIYYKKATNAALSMNERLKAVKSLKSEYPDYFKKLKDETILVGDAAAAYRQLSRDIRESALAKGIQDSLTENQKTIIEWRTDNYDEAQWLAANSARVKQLKSKGVKGKAPKISTGTAIAAATNVNLAGAIIQSEADKDERTPDERLVYEFDSRYRRFQAKFKRENKDTLKKINTLTKMAVETTAKDVHAETPESGEASAKQNKAFWEKQRSDAQQALDAMSDAQLKTQEAKELKDKITEAEKHLKERSELTSTATTEKSAHSAGKAERDATTAEAKKTQRAIEDAIMAETQLAISKRNDGLSKELAQIQLNHDKRVTAIERALEDEQERLQQADLKKGIKKELPEYMATARLNVGYDTEIKSADEQQEQQTQKAYQKQLDALADFIKQYGTQQEKRIMLEKEYAARIADAQNEGNFGDVLKLKAERDKALSELQATAQSVDWQSIFGDISVLSRSQLEHAKAFLKEKLSSGDLTVEQYKTTTEQIDKINAQLVSNEHTLTEAFGLQTEHLKKQRKLQLELTDAAQAEADAAQAKLLAQSKVINLQFQLQRQLKAAGLKADTTDTTAIVQAVSSSNAISQAVKDKILDTISELSAASAQSEMAAKNQQTASQRYRNVQQQQQQESQWRNQISSLGFQFSSIGGNGQSLLSTIGGSSTATKVMSNVYSALNSAGAAMSDIGNNDYTSAAQNAAASLASVAVAIDAATDSTEYYQIKLNSLQTAMQTLSDNMQTLISKIAKSATTLVDAISYADRALEALNKSVENAREIASTTLNAGASYGEHSYGVRAYKGSDSEYAWKDYIEEIAESVGIDYNSIKKDIRLTWLTELSGEQLSNIKENFYFLWAELPDAVQQAFEQIINYEDNANTILDSLKEKATGFSFDSLTSSFSEALMSMDADVDDFVEDVNKKFMQAALTNYVTSTMGDRLQAWYDDFAETMQAGGLTSSDVARLRTAYEEMAAEALDVRDAMAQITDYDITSSTTSSSKGVEAMSSVQADELNGRFTALQIAGEAIRKEVEAQSINAAQLLSNVQLISVDTSSIAKGIAQSVEIQQTSATHLAKIENYTSNLPAMLAALNNIDKNTKNL